MEYLAHINGDKTQSIKEHCRETAAYAAEDVACIGLRNTAYLAGLIHDMGKYTDEFQSYIRAAASGEDVVRGSVIHSFQACRYMLDKLHGDAPNTYEDITCELIAFAAGAHHGLFDAIDPDKRCGFSHRRNSEKTHYEQAVQRFVTDCASNKEIDELFKASCAEMVPIYEKINALTADADEYGEELKFQVGFLARLLLSAVIDGDRKSTTNCYSTAEEHRLQDTENVWTQVKQSIEGKLRQYTIDSDIQKARAEISNRCAQMGAMTDGVYRLNAPTGAGKTVSSLRFAVEHCIKNSKRRIIFTSPLLTILEQNAAVLRDFIGNDSIVLEHHSNMIRDDTDDDTLSAEQLLIDSWDSPVIITTMVQMLNTLLSGKTSCIRRLQALCNSVIVIDEVQTVPSKMLSLFDGAVNFLATVCNTTVVLCSATQPCLESADRPLRIKQTDIIPYDKALWAPFKRTVIRDMGVIALHDMPRLIDSGLESVKSILVICNKRAEAEQIFSQIHRTDVMVFHMSASMCTQHRRDVLRDIYKALDNAKNGGPQVVCIATQVVEAGVDISFEKVIRLAAGMDSIVQAAGRCNRNGENSNLCEVDVVNCAGENLKMLPDIQMGKNAAIQLMSIFKAKPEALQNDLLSDAAVEYYYKRLYQEMPEGYQDDTTNVGKSIYAMLSDNESFADDACEDVGAYFLTQAFRTAGSNFAVFDSRGTDAVVPYGEGANLIAELEAQSNPTLVYMKQWLDRAKPFTISLYDYQIEKMGPSGLRQVNNITIISKEHYNMQTGLKIEETGGWLAV